jgi:toxin FitB
MFVLDTNVVSELRKVRHGKADANVAAWAENADADSLFVSAISILELELGVLSVERRDAAQGAVLRDWLAHHVLPEFSARTLAVDTAVALRCARLHVPDRRSERDALIAASAHVHGMTVVTRNIVDFQGTGVPLINPWDR